MGTVLLAGPLPECRRDLAATPMNQTLTALWFA